MPARQQIVCVQCDKTEEYCDCEKYCTICKGQHNIRLCADGLYYCPDCREACDVSLANDRQPCQRAPSTFACAWTPMCAWPQRWGEWRAFWPMAPA
jgi:hypothetical protein